MLNLFKILVFICCLAHSFCLYPFETKSRSKVSLNGLWQFKIDFQNEGFTNHWFDKVFSTEFTDSLPIAVPSSFNDLYTDRSIKDHLGWFWYNRQFYLNDAILSNLKNYSVSLRLASCHYYCVVWLNGVKLGQHESGHLPFEFDIKQFLLNGKTDSGLLNLVVAANNTLTPFTIPPARLFYGTNPLLYPDGYVEQQYQMDFYNFAGIHRDVIVYIKPVYSIEDLIVKSDYMPDSKTGVVNYNITYSCYNDPDFIITIRDHRGNSVATSSQSSGVININNVIPWWPKFLNGDQPVGYLYKIEVQMSCDGSYNDTYSLDFGVRSISWAGNYKPSWQINSKNFYCRGANRHEDFPVIGRGIDFALMLKDVYLLEWLNVNCVRTSHYPYAEEFMQLADRLGIAIIDEVPAVGLTLAENYNPITLQLHKNLLQELYNRDKNHACVIAWSVANEPGSELPQSLPYFQEIFHTINQIDPTRPKTFTVAQQLNNDICANLSDIIFVNRYYAWYAGTGRLDIIKYQLTNDLENWYKTYGKPLVLSEYGADTLPGTHCYPEQMFCEEYQSTLLMEHHRVFDDLRAQSILFGELIWNMIDFMTAEDVKRAYGNHKGMFTFDRQPKQAAFILKNRYGSMKTD